MVGQFMLLARVTSGGLFSLSMLFCFWILRSSMGRHRMRKHGSLRLKPLCNTTSRSKYVAGVNGRRIRPYVLGDSVCPGGENVLNTYLQSSGTDTEGQPAALWKSSGGSAGASCHLMHVAPVTEETGGTQAIDSSAVGPDVLCTAQHVC